MKLIVYTLTTSILSWAGWKIGVWLSSDPTWALLLACIGTLAGVVVGWKICLSADT